MERKTVALMDRIKPYEKRKIMDRSGYIIDFLEIRATLRQLRQLEDAIKKKKGKKAYYLEAIRKAQEFLARGPPISPEVEALKREQMRLAMQMDRTIAENLRLQAQVYQADKRLTILNCLLTNQEGEMEQMALETAQVADIEQLSAKVKSEEEHVQSLYAHLTMVDSTLDGVRKCKHVEVQARQELRSYWNGPDELEEEEEEEEYEAGPAKIMLPAVPARVQLFWDEEQVKVKPAQVTIAQNVVYQSSFVRPPGARPPTMAGVRICHLFQFSFETPKKVWC
jgi:chromosome segregation ATPase